MHRRRRLADCSALLPRTAASGVNGSCRSASGAPGSPPGRALPGAGFTTNFAGQGREGGGRLSTQSQVAGPGGPATVPGQRPAPLEGRRGGGHRCSYSGLARGSQLGPAPRSLSLTCLTPPQPGPALFRRLAVPAPPPPPAPGAVRTAPRPHPTRCPPRRRSPGEPGRELFALNGPRLRAEQPPPFYAPPPQPQAPPLGEGPSRPSLELPGPEPAGT
ncbi:basic proline-rich protein-like [Sciurus carolinensis]|uniref:basic proline-rich protein-like n=1 Tax=Sciurus carolinensis TaxID=30640 RepID=UPI001FB4E5C1|nr:basic proline-rich protein-like [Sciurus carolinensis]